MGSILKLLLAVMLLFIVITIAAFVYLPWWGALLVVLAMFLIIIGAIRYITRNLGKMLGKVMLKAFETKSRVLRDAQVAVNHVEATLKPGPAEDETDEADVDDDDDEGDDADTPAAQLPRAYYRLDVTITPRAASGEGMRHWDVDDLRLVPFDAPKPALDLNPASGDGFQDGFNLEKIQVLENGQFVDDQQGKHEGLKQLRATVGVPMHVRRLKFQYYTEQFGSIDLPQPLPQLD